MLILLCENLSYEKIRIANWSNNLRSLPDERYGKDCEYNSPPKR